MKTAAFSLMELLVVVAIISVLAALLLPTLERSVMTAYVANCGGTLRQCYSGMMQYQEDYRTLRSQTDSLDYELAFTSPTPETSHKYLVRYVGQNLLMCPANPYFAGTAAVVGRAGYFFVGPGPKWQSVFKNAADLPVMSDRCGMPFRPDLLWTDSAWENPANPVRQSNHVKGDPQGLNALYMDGHVVWLPLSPELWWGPRPAYPTSARRLVPPGAVCSSVGKGL